MSLHASIVEDDFFTAAPYPPKPLRRSCEKDPQIAERDNPQIAERDNPQIS
jgi:hypothetical protein